MKDKSNPFKVVPLENLGRVKNHESFVLPGNNGEIRYSFTFDVNLPDKAIVINGKKVARLFNGLRRTLKAYMKEAQK